MAKKRFYVVWNGLVPGIYKSWDECQEQIKGVKQALYKSFDTLEEAERAYSSSPREYIGQGNKEKAKTTSGGYPPEIIKNALAVDAACSGNPGMMEYRGVYIGTGEEIFHFGPMFGTNNIGEFLAIVHGLALLKQRGIDLPIYSDSRNALLWVKAKQCKTKLPRDGQSEELFKYIERAEKWLKENSYKTVLIKWETDKWGEIPADFGRK
ncbi:MAG: ribonuclease H family protein [Bacteroidaceae bacterium]|nr:ribonuclease H family protein [Bacteroidaceae bacterium]